MGGAGAPVDARTSTYAGRLEHILPHPMGHKAADKVLIHLIEADVDIGFGLVDEAKAYCASGQPEFRSRALQDAADVVADIERRLKLLGDRESRPFLSLVAELRDEIAAAERESS